MGGLLERMKPSADQPQLAAELLPARLTTPSGAGRGSKPRQETFAVGDQARGTATDGYSFSHEAIAAGADEQQRIEALRLHQPRRPARRRGAARLPRSAS